MSTIYDTDGVNWLQDPNVKVYAAEHLPVVRVRDGEPYHVEYFESTSKWECVFLSQAVNELGRPVRTAWERLGESTPKPLPNPNSMDGFYYLRPEQRKVFSSTSFEHQPEMTPPELVPCDVWTADAIQAIEKCGFDKALPSLFTWANAAALIFHLPERECGAYHELIEHFHCSACHGTGTIPERIHVEVRDGEE